MNQQKDSLSDLQTNKIGSNMSNTSSVFSSTFSSFTNKKTHKLVTALYMVTDCMETGDALKVELRNLGIELVSLTHLLSKPIPNEKHFSISHLRAHIDHIISLVEIAGTIGFVSEMNARILKKEFNLLSNELLKYQDKNSVSLGDKIPFSGVSVKNFSLDEKSLEVMLPVYDEPELLPASTFWQDGGLAKGQIRDTINAHKNNTSMFPRSPMVNKEDKSERVNKIIDIIKDKKEVSIKDITYSFKDCSEKTIQRDLNNLVALGKIKKVGEKRWSKYIAL